MPSTAESLRSMPLELIAEPERSTNTVNLFADRTRRTVDAIVDNVIVEFAREVADLRRQLEDFEALLISRAAQTKEGMTSYIDLVIAGHDLTRQVRERIELMRAAQDLVDGNEVAPQR